ncbi:MAG: ATP-binding protein [Deltaproteobacteria bacterium]|jgi:hypothetical protein|nr:ATP-binding protein [Deltaproteobacteria bacterium]
MELPAGIQDFDKLLAKSGVYVDKTKYFPMLPKKGSVVFCARPRRFGKSLTVSAMEAFYSGRKELFKSLAAGEFMNSPEFTPKPVIHLDMSRIANSEGLEVLKERLSLRLESIAKRHKIAARGANPGSIFSCLMEDIHAAFSQRIILLIDEYDAPVIRFIQKELTCDHRLVEDTREYMRDFYSLIKADDEHLDFVFITGISKFSGMGVFSALNNLVDISTEPEFAAFMGLTQEELEVNFAPYIKATAQKMRMDENELLDHIRDYYDGFSFDGETRVYNPFSTLLFFSKGAFKKYWPWSGSNTFIRKFLKDKKLTVEEFSGLRISSDFADSPGEIGSTPPAGFLYQAGYLTLRKDNLGSYSLDYPNFEVRAALSALFLDNCFASETQAMEAVLNLGDCLAAGDVLKMIVLFWRMYAGLTYQDHKAAMAVKMSLDVLAGIVQAEAEKPPEGTDKNPNQSYLETMRQQLGESFYRSVLYAFLCGAEAEVSAEKHSSVGRADLEVKYKGLIYIIELKTARGSGKAVKAARDGMAQIQTRDYGGADEKPILISLAVNLEKSNIEACVFKKNGKTAVLDSQEVFRLTHPGETESD